MGMNSKSGATLPGLGVVVKRPFAGLCRNGGDRRSLAIARTIAKRAATGFGAAWFALSMLSASAQADRIALDQVVTHFDPRALGGITTILRYYLAAPNRMDTEILFLAANEPGAMPVAVQLLDAEREKRRPLDSQGADCTLVRIGMFKADEEVALFEASRDWAGHVLSDPAPMRIQFYRLERGHQPGDSGPLFRAWGPPMKTEPMCDIEDVDKAINAAASRWRASAAAPPHSSE